MSLGHIQLAGAGGYRGRGEAIVKLRNGAAVRVRPIRPDDGPRLLALCDRLSPGTVYQRFFSVRRLRPEDAQAFASVDYRARMAVVAEVDAGHEPQLIGVARCALSAEATIADIALVVAEAIGDIKLLLGIGRPTAAPPTDRAPATGQAPERPRTAAQGLTPRGRGPAAPPRPRPKA